jgi:uncharacterized membrane protein YdcZ (DUF606 family)
MRWYGYDIVMLVAYGGLLAICGAYLAFGWRFPGTFRRRLEAARLRAWAGVSLATGLLIVVFLDAATDGLNDFSGEINRWLLWLDGLIGALILASFVLLGTALRVSIRTQRDGGGGKHAAGRHEAPSGAHDWPESGS